MFITPEQLAQVTHLEAVRDSSEQATKATIKSVVDAHRKVVDTLAIAAKDMWDDIYNKYPAIKNDGNTYVIDTMTGEVKNAKDCAGEVCKGCGEIHGKDDHHVPYSQEGEEESMDLDGVAHGDDAVVPVEDSILNTPKEPTSPPAPPNDTPRTTAEDQMKRVDAFLKSIGHKDTTTQQPPGKPSDTPPASNP